MKSKISFFNKTIFLKNVTLYWPIWTVYTLFLLGGLPVSLWFSMQGYSNDYYLTEERMIRELYYTIQPTYYIGVIAFTAVIVGMALFSYLYKSQSANMIHSLPVDRTELFGTNVISGLAFLILPQIFTFVVTILVCLNVGITRVEYLAMWLLVVIATAIIAYAFVTFCAFLTGQLVTLPIYVVIMNFLAYAFDSLIRYMVELFAYGVNAVGLLADDVLIWFSPFVCYLSKVNIDYIRDNYNKITALEMRGLDCIILYLIVAIGLYVAAYFIYRIRKIEHAGDLITVGILKPIFRWGVGTLAGFYVTIFFTLLFESIGFEFSIVSFTIGLLFFGALFYFIADMFVRKTFRVFKRQNLKGCGMFCIITLVLFGVISIYANVEERRIPKLADVEYASISAGYYSEYDGEDVQKIIDIHEEILENINYYEELYRNNSYYSYDAEWIYFNYKLKDGSYISRNYRVPYEDEGKEIIDKIQALEKEPENFLKNMLGNNYDEVEKFNYGYLNIWSYTEPNKEGVMIVEDTSKELTTTECKKLYEAIIADGLAGTLIKYNSDYAIEDESWKTDDSVKYHISLEYVWSQRENAEGVGYDSYEYYNTPYINFGKDCENIINAIIELGISGIDSVEDIYWGGDTMTAVPRDCP